MKMKSILASFILTTSVLFLGFYVGFREGVEKAIMVENIVRGELARHQLAALTHSDVDSVSHLFQLSVCIGLENYRALQGSVHKRFAISFLPVNAKDVDQYADNMRAYVKSSGGSCDNLIYD